MQSRLALTLSDPMELCKNCGLYAGTHACDQKDVKILKLTKAMFEASKEIERLRAQLSKPQPTSQDVATKAEREACLEVVISHKVPVGNSVAGELAHEWTVDALAEIRDAILARSNG